MLRWEGNVSRSRSGCLFFLLSRCSMLKNAQQIKCFVLWLLTLLYSMIIHQKLPPWDKTALMWTRTLKVLMIIFKITQIRTVCMFVTKLDKSKLSNDMCWRITFQCSALVLKFQLKILSNWVATEFEMCDCEKQVELKASSLIDYSHTWSSMCSKRKPWR